jgi:hypothetical protein
LTKRVLGKPLLNNLAICRQAPPQLLPHEESRLIRDGDHAELITRHLPYIRAECRKRWQNLKPWLRPERSNTWDDFVAASVERCLVAARNTEPGANNGFNAYARHWIAGAISDTAANYRNAFGFAGIDGDLQRIVRSRLFQDPEWIREKYPQYTAAQIEEAQEIARVLMRRNRAMPPEEFRDAQSAYRTGAIASLLELRPIVGGRRVKPQALWHLRGAHAWVGRVRIRNNSYVTKYSAGSLWNDLVWRRRDERERAMMQWMGRQRYAEWLVDRKSKYGTGSACPPFHFVNGKLREGNEPPAPYVSKIAAHYRKKGWDIPTLMLDAAVLELRALEQRTKPTTNIRKKVAI